MNHFWRLYEMGQRGEHGIWSHTAPSWESPFVSASFLEVQRELLSQRAFRVEYGAEFLDTAGRVFRTECLERCVIPRLPDGLSAPYHIGVDWARYQDYTAVCVLCGSRESAFLVDSLRIHAVSWSEQVERVAEFIERYDSSHVVCDATGVGDPVIEMLQTRLRNASIEGLVFTQRIKSELIHGLAWLVERGGLLMEPFPELMKEMQHFEATPGKKGSKLGARSGYHDDLVVALALAAHTLPRRPSKGLALGQTRRFAHRHARTALWKFGELK